MSHLQISALRKEKVIELTDAELAAEITTARTGRSSWRYFMIAALVLLVLFVLFDASGTEI